MRKRNIVSYFLIVGGVLVLSYPFIAQAFTNYEQKKLMNEYEQIIFEYSNGEDDIFADSLVSDENIDKESINNENINNEAIDSEINLSEEGKSISIPSLNHTYQNTMKEEPFDEEMSEKDIMVDSMEVLDNLLQVTKDSQQDVTKSLEVEDYLSRQKIIGMIEINKINLKMIIVEGTDWDNIRVTIGHMSQTKGFGELGNCAIAGHRGGTYGTFFKHIDKLEEDDEVRITDLKGKVYKYKVYKQFVTEPTDMAVIDDIEGEKTLTLISCENNGEDRLIVYAKMD